MNWCCACLTFELIESVKLMCAVRYGWGTSFHFAQRTHRESLYQSLARHEHFLALKLGLNSNKSVIGEPMIVFVFFS
jgi:hypothetical protein